MSENVSRMCRYCRRRQLVRFESDGQGRVVEEPLACRCDARRRRGICLDCPEPVEGTVGLALRCRPCKKVARLAYVRRWRQLNPERVDKWYRQRRAQRRRRRRTKAGGEDMRAHDREYRRANKDRINAGRNRRNQENREHREQTRREWVRRNPESVKRSQDKANAKRRQAARDYMHDYATKYVGIGCEPPKCRTCGDEVPFDGLGRPRLDCPKCRARTGLAA